VAVKRQVTSQELLDESYIDPGVDLTLARNVTFFVYHSFHTDSFGGREYGYDFNVVDAKFRSFKRVALEYRIQWGRASTSTPRAPRWATPSSGGSPSPSSRTTAC
jgi:hypothetical protein